MTDVIEGFDSYVPSRGKTHKPKVTIGANGVIGVNEAGKQKFKLGDFSYCRLHCSKDRKVMAIQPVGEADKEGAVTMKLRQTGASISGKGFAEYFNILPEKTSVYDCHQNEQGLILVDLSSGVPRNRKLKQEAV